MNKILIVDDDRAIVESLRFAYKDEYELFLAYNGEEALNHYKNNEIDVTILDMKLGKEDGMEIFSSIREINPEAIVIIITAYGTINSTVEAIKSGIFYYLTKPIDLDKLDILLLKGVEINKLYKKINLLSEESREKYEDYGIVAKSNRMKNILNTVEKIKDIDSNILITGESGTGKSMLAKVIHEKGHRSDKPFHTINCAAIPEELLESELFGYKKGAFTGANKDKKGFFELANKGTLFLDEIGDMSLNLQGKILYAIQEKKIIPVGGIEEIEVDVRIITATNRDIMKLVNENKFREDLFYRINIINIHMPALRDREEDIPYLIKFFVDKHSKLLNKGINKIEHSFIHELEKLNYNGNIRELENIVERSIALSNNGVLTMDNVQVFNKKAEKQCTNKLIPIFVGESLDCIERKVIEETYKFCSYNQKEASKVLGITTRTIRNKMKIYNNEKNN